MVATRKHDIAQMFVVAGGLARLSAAILLADRCVDVRLVERHAATSRLPRAHLLNQRTMEIFMEMGAAAEVYALSPPEERWRRVAWHTTVAGADRVRGRVLGFLPAWGGGPDVLRYAAASACRYAYVPQLRSDLLLRAHTEEVGGPDREWFGHDLTGLNTGDGSARATVVDRASGAAYTVDASYSVAADGGRNCASMLGIGMQGPAGLQDMVTVHANADLSALADDDEVLLRYFINPDGQGSFAGAMCAMGPTGWGGDSPDWALHTGFPTRFDTTAVLGRIRRMLGIPDLEFGVHAVSRWEFEGVVAQRFRRGPMFLGGQCLNTAVQDVQNLVWKLDTVLSGQAGEELLDSYDAEHRPVGACNVRHCLNDASGVVVAEFDVKLAVVVGVARDRPGQCGTGGCADGCVLCPKGNRGTALLLGLPDLRAQLRSDSACPPTLWSPTAPQRPRGGHPPRDYLPTTPARPPLARHLAIPGRPAGVHPRPGRPYRPDTARRRRSPTTVDRSGGPGRWRDSSTCNPPAACRTVRS